MSAIRLLQGVGSRHAAEGILDPASWGAVAIQCSCGKINDALFHPTLRVTGLDRNASCPRCGEAFTADRRVVHLVDRAVRGGSLLLANRVLLGVREKLERLAALMAACPHCGKALASEEALAAATALLRLVDPSSDEPDPDT